MTAWYTDVIIQGVGEVTRKLKKNHILGTEDHAFHIVVKNIYKMRCKNIKMIEQCLIEWAIT